MSSAVNPPSGERRTPSGQRRTGAPNPPVAASSRDVVAEQKDRFGGMKFGACFFGWLAATGTAVLLTALLTAIGAGVGLRPYLSPAQVQENAQTVGIVGGIVLLVIVLIAYFCGGYVAGRMARFNGSRQGVGVWLWAVIAAVVVTVLSLIAGTQFDALTRLNGVPQLPVGDQTLTWAGVILAVAVVLIALVGAVLGGLAGMRYHRRIDRATHDEGLLDRTRD